MRALRRWRESRATLVAVWLIALLTPHAWRTVAPHLRPAVPRAGTTIRTRAGASPAEQRDASQFAPEAGALGHTRATTFAAGTNLKKDGAGAAWTFLLPSLELGLALSVGTPSAASLRTLSRLADEVVVACHDASDRRRLRRRSSRIGISNVRPVRPTVLTAGSLEPDLVVLSEDAARRCGGDLRAVVTRARAVFLDGAAARADHAPAAELSRHASCASGRQAASSAPPPPREIGRPSRTSTMWRRSRCCRGERSECAGAAAMDAAAAP